MRPSAIQVTLSGLGRPLLQWARRQVGYSAVAAGALVQGFKPRHWSRPVRDVLARQLLFTGVEALRFVALVGLLVGVSAVVQAQLWLLKLGQSELLGPLLVLSVVREAGPLFAGFVVVARSGTAVATELATMNVVGEVRVLDAQGLDPFVYLVMPRVLGMALATFGVAVVFILVALVSGYISGPLLGAETGSPAVFLDSLFKALRPVDLVSVAAKTLPAGLLIGSICCVQGMAVENSITEIPQAATRAVVASITALFLVTAAVSVATYLLGGTFG